MEIVRKKRYLKLHFIYVLYSLCAVCSKMASQQEFLSAKFFLLYSLSLAMLAAYAVFWQQILKYFTLSTAFANKSITILWGMLWAKVFFQEVISLKMILGAVLISGGILLVVTSND